MKKSPPDTLINTIASQNGVPLPAKPGKRKVRDTRDEDQEREDSDSEPAQDATTLDSAPTSVQLAQADTAGASPAADPVLAGGSGATTPAAPEAPSNTDHDSQSILPWLGMGALALAATGAGAGSGAAAVSNFVTGVVVAGPVVGGNGLKVEIFAANGTSKLGEAPLDTNGKFTVNIGSYTGIVIARVVDTSTGVDYLDEATNAPKDLNATLMATTVVPGGIVTININPLTTIAAQKAGLAADGSGSLTDTAAVTNANAAVAAAFGLTDLIGTTAVATNGGNFNATDGLSEGEKIGAILAALSGADQNNNDNSQATINTLVANLTASGTGGTLTLNSQALDLVISGANMVDAIASGGGSALTAVGSTLTGSTANDTVTAVAKIASYAEANTNTAPSVADYAAAGVTGVTSANLTQVNARVDGVDKATADTTPEIQLFVAPAAPGFDVVASDDTINAAEVSSVITGTSEAGATVALNIGGIRTATVTGTTWSYALTADDIIAMSEGAETLSATQTDAAGNTSAVGTRDIIIDTTAPTITSSTTATAINENSSASQVIYAATSTDTTDYVAGSTTYSLKAGSDAAAFSINASTGAVSLTANPDFETQASYSFTVIATDAAGNASEKAVTLAINNLDEVAPAFTSTTATAINENSVTGQIIYTAITTDSGDIATGTTAYSLKAGSDAGLTIDSATGAVTLTGSPDFETKASYSFTVVATDAANNATEKVVTLAVNNLDEVAPTISTIAITSASGAQNSLLSAGDTLSITVTLSEAVTVTGTPQLALNIGGTTVQANYTAGSTTTALVFQYTVLAEQTDSNGVSVTADSVSLNNGTIKDVAGNNATLTHAAIADNGSYLIDTAAPTLTSSTPADGGVNAPAANLSFTFSEKVQKGSGNIRLVNDTDTTTVTIDITSSDVTVDGDTITLNPTANLLMTKAYHIEIDAGALLDAAGNTYAGLTGATALNFTVPDPAVSLNAIASENRINATENAGIVTLSGTLSSDTSSVISGFAQADFSVILTPSSGSPATATMASYNTSTGGWTATVAANTLVDGQTYAVRVLASSGGFTAEANGKVMVDTSVATPTLALASDTGSSDSDGITNSEQINVSGLQAGATWQYSTNAGSNWTTGSGSSFAPSAGSYSANTIQVRQTDIAGNISTAGTHGQVLTIDFTLPSFASGATATAINENSGTGQVVYTAEATDSRMLSYSLNAGGGDAALLSIDSTTGAVTLIGNPDFDVKPSYSFMVMATDAAGNASGEEVTLAINNVINENSGSGQVIYTASTLADTVYSLKADTGDAAAFSIDASTGAVTLTDNPDFEVKPSYSFTVVATDDMDDVIEKAITLVINNLVEAAPIAAPTLALASDTGSSASDGITNNEQINVSGLQAGATWQYSTDAGTNWTNGSGTSFALSEGIYIANAIQVRQTDLAGNVSANASIAFTLDQSMSQLITVQSYPLQPSPVGTQVFAGIPIPNVGDLNGDGRMDLVVGEGGGSSAQAVTVRAYLQQSDGTFVLQNGAAGSANPNPFDGINFVADTPNGATGIGLSLIDVDADGKTDMLVSFAGTADQQAGILYYRNTGTAQVPAYELQQAADNPFASIARGYLLPMATGDWDGDGDADLVLGHFSQVADKPALAAPAEDFAFWRNNGNGTFTQLSGAANPLDAINAELVRVPAQALGVLPHMPFLGDFNGDGHTDFALYQPYWFGGVGYLAGDGQGGFSAASGGLLPVGALFSVPMVAVADVNGDGLTDFILGDSLNGTNVLSLYTQQLTQAVGLDPSQIRASVNVLKAATYDTANLKLQGNGAEALALIDVYVNGQRLLSTQAGSTGQWTATWSGQEIDFAITPDTSYAITTTQTDTAGNTSVASEAYTLQVASPPPSLSDLRLSKDTGTFGNDFITQVASQTITATLSRPLLSTETVFAITATGQTWVDITNKVSGVNLSWNGVVLGATGQINIHVSNGITDNAVTQDYVLDTAAPVAPATALATDSGNGASDGISTSVAITAPNHTEANALVEYRIQAGTNAFSTWSASYTAPTNDGSYTLQVRQTDLAGNVSGIQTLSFTLDATLPNFTSATAVDAINENSGANQVIYTAQAADTSALSYSLTSGSDAGLRIDAGTGAVTLTDAPDFETKANYAFTVAATDMAGNVAEQAHTLAINDLDEVAPSIQSVAITSAVGIEGNTLNAGDVLSLTVTMSENTYVADTATLAINVGNSTVQAAYASGSGSTALVFNYTVLAGQTDTDGISINANAISLGSSYVLLRDAAGNTANLSHAAVASNGDYLVDTSASPPPDSNGPADTIAPIASMVAMPGVQLEALGMTNGVDQTPQISAVGRNGDYVVVFSGMHAVGNALTYGIFVQKFSATGLTLGAMVKLDSPGYDSQPQVSAVGLDGEFVVTWSGLDSNTLGQTASQAGSVFVQKFNADGTVSGNTVALEVADVLNGANEAVQVSAVGDSGAFVVTWEATDTIFRDKSIFLQRFDNAGQSVGNVVKLEAPGVSSGNDTTPQVTGLDSEGSYVVTWSGAVVEQGVSIYVQQFNGDGSTTGHPDLRLEAVASINGNNMLSQVSAVGSTGAYVVTWSGANWAGVFNIFVQQFSATDLALGAKVTLESNETTTGNDYAPQVTAVGSAGAYVVTWYGYDAAGSTSNLLGQPVMDASIYVQKFNADGSTTGHAQVKLEALQNTLGNDVYPQITAVGSGEDFVVTWQGVNAASVSHVYAQKFNSDGTVAGDTAQLVALGNPAGPDTLPQVAAVGSTGAYAITWQGKDAEGGDDSIFVQQFYANGTPYDNPALSAAGSAKVLSTELGMAYLVDSSLAVTNLTDITNAADNRWNQVAISQVNTPTDIAATGLRSGSYKLYTADAAGNLSAPVAQQVTVDAVAPTARVQLIKPAVQLEAIGNTALSDYLPQVSAVGSAGAYVVTWYGKESLTETSIYVQQFNANGTTTGYAPVELEAINNTAGFDDSPQVSALGSDGAYVVTWSGVESAGDYSIFVQQFNADGTTTGHGSVQLEAIGISDKADVKPQVSAVGSDGAYVVTWAGPNATGNANIYVQKFNANGTITGNVPVLLAVNGVVSGYHSAPQVSAVGDTGAFVVTWWASIPTEIGFTIYVQQFNANGTTTGRATVRLDAPGNTTGHDVSPTVTSVGSDGAYVVAWTGQDSGGDNSIFVQRFNANGTTTGVTVQLEAIGNTAAADDSVQVIAVGSAGDYVVTWSGLDSEGDASIFVQKFNADGSTTGYEPVRLEAIGKTDATDNAPQISAVGDQGNFVVTWVGIDSVGDASIFVQGFGADGKLLGKAVQLEAIGRTNAADSAPQISSVGSDGAYVVTWKGVDSNGDDSIFVQQFNADGTLNHPTLLNAAATVNVQSTEAGTAYLVNTGVTVSNLASITGAADAQWNQVALPSANSDTLLATTGLADGSYRVYTADVAGNLSAPEATLFTVDATAPTVRAIAITSATGVQDNAFNAGDVLSVTVSMSEDTTVTGTPQLGLNIGGTVVQAQYVSGSGNTALLFNYTLLGSQSDSNGVSIDASSLALNGAKLVDAAGNAAVLSHAVVADNASYAVLDITAPLASGATAYVSNIGNAVVKSTEVGTAYLVRNTLAVSQLSDITGAADALWNKESITTANTYTALSVAGLEAGVYKAYTADASGNLSAVSDYTNLVSNISTTAIQLTGSQLIAPWEVDGKWYAFWDLNNSGTATAADKTADHNADLDNVFKFASDFTTIKPGWITGVAAADTTDTYRFATLNGMKLALPTSLEMSAIKTSAVGVPAGWMDDSGIWPFISPADYNTSTQRVPGTNDNYHMDVRLSTGDATTAYVDSTNAYVALQIL